MSKKQSKKRHTKINNQKRKAKFSLGKRTLKFFNEDKPKDDKECDKNGKLHKKH